MTAAPAAARPGGLGEAIVTCYRTPNIPGYERVLRCDDHASGLRTVIAVHDTTPGPALGGCRMWTCDSGADALAEALRLARGAA